MQLLPTLLVCLLALVTPDDVSPEAHRHNQEGVRLFQKKEFAGAEVEFRKARELAPKSEAIRKNLGNCLLEIGAAHLHDGEFDDAIQALDEAVDLLPRDGEAHYRLGVALHKRQRYGDAIGRLEHAVRLKPKHREAFIWLGRAYYEAGEIDRAIEPLETALGLDGKDEETKEFLDRVRREADVEKDFHEDYSEHFLIQASGKVALYVRERVRTELENAFSDVATALDHNPDLKIPAILYSEKEFRTVTRSHEWVGGVFDGKIRIPVKGFDDHKEELRKVIRHEVTHALVRVSCKGAPRWFNEGIAQYLDGTDRAAADSLAREAGRKGEIPDLAALEMGFGGTSHEKVTHTYQLALSFVSFLAWKEGERSFGALARACREGRSFEAAVEEAFGDPLDDLAEAWAEKLGQRSR